MHGSHRIAGTGPRPGFAIRDLGADFDPDAGHVSDLDADTLRSVLTLRAVVAGDEYLHRLSVACADLGATDAELRDAYLGTLAYVGYVDCLRVQRRALLRRAFSRRARSAVHRARAVAAAPGRSARGATASPPVML